MQAPSSPQLRFLLRGSVLLVAMLALWWWVLLNPLLGWVRLSTELTLRLLAGASSTSHITVDAQGDWTLQVPLPAFVSKRDTVQQMFGPVPKGTSPVKVRSFKLEASGRYPVLFTLGFPLYWAMVLAAPRSKRIWRALIRGTALVAIIAPLSLMFYVVYAISEYFHLIPAGPAHYMMDFGEYLNLNVTPYAAPVLIAMWLHTELRSQIFSWDARRLPVPIASPPPGREARRRGRYRRP